MKHTASYIALAAAMLLTACGGSETTRIASRMSGFGFINLPEDNGRYMFRGLYHDGLAYCQDKDYNQGFINTDGEMVVDLDGYRPETMFSFFSEDLLLAQKAAVKFGDISHPTITAFDKNGDIVFEVEAKLRTQMRGGYALCDIDDDNRLDVIDSKGEVVFESTKELYIGKTASFFFTTPASCARPSCFPAFSEGELLFVDVATGEHILEGLVPDDIDTYGLQDYSIDSNDRVVLKTRDGYGLLRLDGTWAVEPQYDLLINDGEWYVFRQDGLVGWLDKDGNVTIEPQFDVRADEVAFGGSDYCCIDSHTIIDRKGDVVLETGHEILTGMIFDRCIVRVGSICEWMKPDGTLVGIPLYLSSETINALNRISRGQAIQYGAS